MKKALIITTLLSTNTLNPQLVNAALVNGSILNFNTAATSGNFPSLPVTGSGSWFAMEVQPDTQVITGISGFNNLILGATQSASSTSVDNIDISWMFSGSAGVHQSTSNTNVLTTSGDTATVDFSGWGVF